MSVYEEALRKLQQKYTGGGGNTAAPSPVPAPATPTQTADPYKAAAEALTAKYGVSAPAAATPTPTVTPTPAAPAPSPVQSFDESPNLVVPMPEMPKAIDVKNRVLPDSPETNPNMTLTQDQAVAGDISRGEQRKQAQQAEALRKRMEQLSAYETNPTHFAAAIFEGRILPQEMGAIKAAPPFAELAKMQNPALKAIGEQGLQDPEAGRAALLDYMQRRETTGYDVVRSMKTAGADAVTFGAQQPEVGPQTPAGEAAYFGTSVVSQLLPTMAAGSLAGRAVPAAIRGTTAGAVVQGIGTGAILQGAREVAGGLARPDEFDATEAAKRIVSNAAQYGAYMGAYSNLNPLVDDLVGAAAQKIGPGAVAATKTLAAEVIKGGVTGTAAGLAVGSGKAVLQALLDEGLDVEAIAKQALEEAGQEAKEEMVEAVALGIVSRLLGARGPVNVQAPPAIAQAPSAPVQQEQAPTPASQPETPPVTPQSAPQVQAEVSPTAQTQPPPKAKAQSKTAARSEQIRTANPGMDEKAIRDVVRTTTQLTDAEFTAFVERMGKPEAPQTTPEPDDAATVDLPGAEVGAPVLSSQVKQLPQRPQTFGQTVKVGDKVAIEGRQGVYEVVDAGDPSLLRVRSEGGAELPVGRATVKPVEGAAPEEQASPQTQKEPWEMTLDEVNRTGYIAYDTEAKRHMVVQAQRSTDTAQTNASEHKRLVAVAISEGKAVPPEVLADYPDLQQTPSQTATPATQQKGEVKRGKPAKTNTEPKVRLDKQYSVNGGNVFRVAYVANPDGTETRIDVKVRSGKDGSLEPRAAEVKRMALDEYAKQQGSVKDSLRSKVDAQEGTGIGDTRVGAVAPQMRPILAGATKQTVDVPAEDAAIEERFQGAKQRPPGESAWQKAREFFRTVKQYITSDLPYLPGGPRYARLAFKLRQLAKGRGTASDEAVLYLQGITTNLKKDEYNLFNRAVVYADILEDVNRGLYETDQELPFGFTADTLRREHARVMQAVEQSSQVKRSLEDRKKVLKEVADVYARLYEKVHGKPPPFNREDYFHHEVLNRLGVAPSRVNGTGEKVHIQKAGWQKARTGSSLDFLTNYLEAEHKVLSEMLYGIKVHQLIEFVEQTEDKSKELKEQAKALSEKSGKKVDWRKLLPEGYTLWQPDEGNFIFRANAIDARLVDEMVEQGLKELNVPAEAIRKVLAIGGRKFEMAIPQEIADTLNHFGKSRPPAVYDTLDKALRWGMGKWKRHQLFFITRVFKYQFRNLSGDIDALVAANPAAIKRVPQAVAELHNFLARGGAPTAELEAWMQRGGMQDVLGIAEDITQIDTLKQLRRFTEQPPMKDRIAKGDVGGVLKDFAKGYKGFIEKSNNLREYTLRYAAFLDYAAQIQKNGKPDNWGASVREEVQALQDPYDMAYELSNDLLGAYDKVSVAGQWVRERIIPFWSWNEVNARRYKRLIENAVRDGDSMAMVGKLTAKKLTGLAVKSPMIAYNLGKFAVKAHALTGLLAAWNYLLFRDEEEDLPESVRSKPHIIFGRDENGEVVYFNRLGAIADFYEWFGLDGATRHVQDYLNGRMTLQEIAVDMVTSPVNKLVQGIGPVKNGIETLLGKTMYPDFRKPRTIRDKGEFLADSLGLGDAYRLAFGKPTRGAGKIIGNMFTYRVDPEEVAYSEMVGMKYEWLKKKKGMGDPSGPISPKSNALYYFKQALRYGDKEAAEKYLRQYVDYGGTSKGLNQSLKALHPLYGMSKEEAAAFIGELTEKEKDQLRTAIDFYGKVLSGEVGN